MLIKPQSWALSFTASNVVSSLSLLCLVLISLVAILRPSELLSSCVCLSILIRIRGDMYGGAPKLSITFRRLIRLGSFPECSRSANVTAIPKEAPSYDREN